ncbi:alpha/beta fold hydrolase [Ferrovibrio xuzhouensis]|uniref:Alpha/beta fold hydrolase n=1 Tax=Ferrovibrio xuzhouensis TaxID=1576914 RepID=A0ABV7VH35_9PROT
MRQPLVFVPGLLLTDDFWREQVARLSGDAQCIVPSGQYHMDSVVDMARAVLAEAPDRFALCGLSMGGYICHEIMRQAPERVIRLALLDTSARPDSPEQTRTRSGFLQLAKTGRFKGITPQLIPYLLHPDNQQDKALVDRLMAMAEEIGRDGYLQQQTAIMGRPDSRPFLPGYRLPTLVLCGRVDKLTPVEVHEEMAALIPGAELTIIEAAGHLPPMETPDQVAEALRRWLTR